MNNLNRLERIKLEVWIDLACDADYQRLANGTSLAARLTIAEALEVLK